MKQHTVGGFSRTGREAGFSERESMSARAVALGQYIVENQATVRSTAGKFGVSKSTVHKDVSERLRRVNPRLYKQVRRVLEGNKSERHIRGGMATREKYRLQTCARENGKNHTSP